MGWSERVWAGISYARVCATSYKCFSLLLLAIKINIEGKGEGR